MAAEIYVNDNGTARRLRQLWVNDNGIARRLRQLWVNDNGTARLIFVDNPVFDIGILIGESSGYVRFEPSGLIYLGAFFNSGQPSETLSPANWIEATGLSTSAQVRGVTTFSQGPGGVSPADTFLSLNQNRQFAVGGSNVQIRFDFQAPGGQIVSMGTLSAGFGGFG